MKHRPPNPRVKLNRLTLLALCAVLSASAQAQAVSPTTVPPGTRNQADTTAEVIKLESFNVSGSLIAGASTFTSPTPVLVIDQADLLAASPVNLAEGLKQLPSIAPGGGQTNGGGTGNSSANFLNLRGLGETRTLILLDGRRYTPSGSTGLVDVNLIPQGLVHHVDVVNGGASAAYGSDAVGGVVNFVLNKEFTGLTLTALTGIAQEGDNIEYKTTLTYGTPYLGGRGHFVFSGEYANSKGVKGDGRDSRTSEANQIPDPANRAMLVRATDIRTPYTPGGHIVTGAGGTAANNALFRGILFGPGGVQRPYDYGTLSNTIGTTAGFQNGGDGFRVGTSQEIVRPLERKNLFARTDFKLRDHLTVFVEGSYAESFMKNQNSPTTHTMTIRRENPFLAKVAPALVAQMTTLGVTTLTMNRLTLERGLTESHVSDTNVRGLAGLVAQLGDWKWETSYQWGRNDLSIPVTNNLITARMAVAVDSILVNGQIVPRAAAANPGSVAFNPFGVGAPSAAALDYVMGRSEFDDVTTQHVADTTLTGDLFDLPAGAVGAAVGAHWRKLTTTTTPNALSVANAYRLANTQPFFGEYTIMEEFAELQVPILKDAALAKRLNVNIAARHTDYSTTGSATTWKAGLVWQINSDLRIRAARSRDIRAPNLNELFSRGRQQNAVIDDTGPGGTGQFYSGVPNIATGNLNLKPEVADSSVIGFVYQPSGLKGLSLAMDFYTTKIEDAIFVAGGAIAVRECNADPNSPLCAFVTRGPTAASPRAVIRTQNSPVNLNSELSTGLDFEVSYRVPLSTWFANSRPGNLVVRALAGYIDEYSAVSPLAPTINQAGNGRANATTGVAALPRVRGNLSFNHTRGAFATFLQMRYIGGMTWDKTRVLGVTTDYNNVPSTAYFDGQIGYRTQVLGRNTEIYLNVANILDRGPTYAPRNTGATPMPTDPGLFDQVGRMYRLGIKTSF